MAKFGLLVVAVAAAGLSVRAEEDLVLELHGSGTTNPSRLFWKVQDVLTNRARLPVRMTYRAIGSSNGQREFTGLSPDFTAFTHFGSGDIPMSQSRYDSIQSVGRQFIHVPFLVGAISYFHSYPLPSGGQLALSACTLARIFQRNITMWNDAAIVAENPGVSLAAQPITVLVRSDGSSSTSLSSSYLNLACPTDFVLTPGSGGSPTSNPVWPAGVSRQEGSSNMRNFIKNTPYSIGYLDSGHGHSANLNEVALTNRRGQTLTAKTADIGAAASNFTGVGIPPLNTDSWAQVNLVNADGDMAWPIVTFSYVYVATDLSYLGQSGALLKAFLTYLLSDETQNANSGHLKDFLFFPLPTGLLTRMNTAVAGLTVASNATEFTFESKATTMRYVGAAKYTLSGKREGWNSHVLEDFDQTIGSASATDLEHNASITALVAQIAALNATIQSMSSASSSSSSDDDDSSNDGLAIAAIIISVLAILITLGVYASLSSKISAGNSAAPTYNNPSYAKASTANGATHADDAGYMDVTGTEQKTAV